jgi:uncharacterized protein YgiM (DUF1202 family)
MRNGLLKTLFLLLLCQSASAAETLYVHDQLRLGVRPAPNSSEKSIASVTTGDALTVLGEQENFINIRTEKGVEGWVSKGYLSAEPPARNQLQSLQQEYEVLLQQQQALQLKFDESQQQGGKSAGALAQLQQENASLQEQLASYTDTTTSFYEQYRWLLLLVVLALCFIAGLIVGIRWKARQVAERIGGLQI